MENSIKLYYNNLIYKLTKIYPEIEAKSISFIVFEHLLNYNKIEFFENQNTNFPPEKINKLNEIEQRLLNFEPVQYILESTEFYNLNFYLNKNVLIPRSETEELVDLIIKENSNTNKSIIDIGTGSGCIAISIKNNIKSANVYATDVSEDALLVAKQNAKSNKINVHFIKDDILNSQIDSELKFDIVVSNPPYIPLSEKNKLNKNVTDFEPHLALFTPADDPLIFYKKIAEFSCKHLVDNGNLYVEVHENFAKDVMLLFESYGYNEVKIINDMNNKPRFVKSKLSLY